MKTFDKKDVFSFLNAEDANAYLAEKGYFGDCISILKRNVYDDCIRTLDEICINYDDQFRQEENGLFYSLFLPACKVIEEKKIDNL